MKAVVFHEHGGPDRLRFEDVDPPKPSAGEVLVRVKACALNHLDIWIRQGIPAYRIPLPHISGCDIAGIVEQIGPAVGGPAVSGPRAGSDSQNLGFAVGDRVFVSPGLSCWRCRYCLSGRDNLCPEFKILGAHVNGGYAELVAVPAVNIIPIPGDLPFEQAAAFPLVSVTAWHMLFTLADLQPGEDVLVIGAGSGVGSVAVQMARLAGGRVITTVGSDEKIPKAKALGADEAINHSTEDVSQRVKALTEGRGVDVVIEHVGPAVWEQCLKSLARGGRLITCGATTGGEATLDLRFLFSRQVTLKGSYMGSRGELIRATSLVAQGKLRPVVDRVFPLREARAAQELMLSRKMFGKIVLAVD
ncbi:MAG TPA: zinc-binding dehydrogenase [Nitrospiraceae bacterium]|jgi:NADPH:quinone reductase-like Zn-dependent oxidoreductase|nr:zinc-binding dehydrogenase [Nitrospiraceae bacterium]